MSAVYDPTQCALGEGPLWHPGLGRLFWFDILGCRLLARDGETTRTWQFDEHVSAAGWIDDATLLVASETRLMTLDLASDRRRDVAPLEVDVAGNRSNDGRADPWGGFWIGTMDKNGAPGRGAIYRCAGGEVTRLWGGLDIPNAICFAPDRSCAYFSDTPKGVIRRVALDADGWPAADPEDWVRLDTDTGGPDGAVVDEKGQVWNAQWGAGRVACYAPDGRLVQSVAIGPPHTTCPAFGGAGYATLFCTTAREGRPPERLTDDDGRTFAVEGFGRGLPEPQVSV